MAWLTPKTDWDLPDGVRNTDFNRIEGNILELHERANRTDVAFDALVQNVEGRLFEISNRASIDALEIGTEFGLYENGVLTPFIKVDNNYNGSSRALIVRRDCLEAATLRETGDTYYDGCRADDWLNSVYANWLDTATQNVISNVYVPVAGPFGEGTIDRRFFLLSMTEYGLTSSQGIPTEGSSISYFNSTARRVAYRNGGQVSHWTRSIDNLRSNAAYVNAFGFYDDGHPNNLELGIRPAFTLPNSYEVVAGMPSTANVMAFAEVI